MDSFDRSASACDGISGWNQLCSTGLDFSDAPLDLGSPRLLDVVILKHARNQAVREFHTLLGWQFQRLGFQDLKPT